MRNRPSFELYLLYPFITGILYPATVKNSIRAAKIIGKRYDLAPNDNIYETTGLFYLVNIALILRFDAAEESRHTANDLA